MVFFGCVLYGTMSLYLTWRNRQRQEGKENYKIAGLSEEEIADMGDESPRFIFAK